MFQPLNMRRHMAMPCLRRHISITRCDESHFFMGWCTTLISDLNPEVVGSDVQCICNVYIYIYIIIYYTYIFSYIVFMSWIAYVVYTCAYIIWCTERQVSTEILMVRNRNIQAFYLQGIIVWKGNWISQQLVGFCVKRAFPFPVI